MSKVLTMLVALALFGALPAVASAQSTPSGEGNVASGNVQDGTINQDAGTGSDDGDNDGDNGGVGGNAGNQACLIQQNAGRDANAACNQEQNFGRGGVATGNGVGGHVQGRSSNVGTVGTSSVGVNSVALARTGFDAWLLALVGGLALAGGVGMLAVQRRLVS